MQHAQTEQAGRYAGALSCGIDAQPLRATRELLRLLPMIEAGRSSLQTPTLAPPDVRERLAASCEACLRTTHLGLAALGQLIARCSLDLQDGTIGQEAVENLGFLMAELGDLASECLRIAAACRTVGEGRAERPCAT
jgi:hypothetical protein